MPVLNALTIYGRHQAYGAGAFPHTPSLQHLVLVHSDASLPSLQSIRLLNIVRDTHRSVYMIPDEASNIEELVLAGSFWLPKSMPNLWRLHMSGALYRSDAEVLHLPSLTHLSLDNHGFHRLDALGQGNGIVLPQLTSLAVQLDLEHSYSNFKVNVESILRRSRNLSIIKGNLKAISMILKLVWEAEGEWSEHRGENQQREWRKVRLLAGQRILIEVEEGYAMLSGDETCHQLCDVAAELKVDLPDASWDDILDEDMYDRYWG